MPQTSPFRRLRAAFAVAVAPVGSPNNMAVDPNVVAQLHAQMKVLDRDPYLHVADQRLGVLSVFDDLKFDRADIDMMTPAMRQHAITKLEPLGFRQRSGNVMEHEETGIRLIIPKFHTQGASPFDITRYTPKRAQDIYLLTPTQTACQFIDSYVRDDAVERIKTLIAKHPINLYRLMDYLENKPTHDAFQSVIGHLKYVQREAVEGEPLQRRRALG
ncbi:MAG: hypothetical protein ACFB11_13680 [Paracoccaceae bacterium]